MRNPRNKKPAQPASGNVVQLVPKTQVQVQTQPHPSFIVPVGFDEWWNCWTIKGTRRNKIAALFMYEFALEHLGATRDQLVVGLCRYMQFCLDNDISVMYIKHPDTWLRKGCWLDEYPEVKKPEP